MAKVKFSNIWLMKVAMMSFWWRTYGRHCISWRKQSSSLSIWMMGSPNTVIWAPGLHSATQKVHELQSPGNSIRQIGRHSTYLTKARPSSIKWTLIWIKSGVPKQNKIASKQLSKREHETDNIKQAGAKPKHNKFLKIITWGHQRS